MGIKIKRHEKYKDKIIATSIHGIYPYKAYLEIRGNSNFGKQIVVISSKQIPSSDLQEISVRLDKAESNKNKTNIVKPNTSNNGYYVNYKVREISILDVESIPIYVFKLETEKEL